MKKMADLRKELGVVSQGRSGTSDDSVLFHLAFRLDTETAKRFILKAADEGISESLYGRKAILKLLNKT